MSQMDYFFVNKTVKSDSLSHSEQDERKAMGAHLLQWHKRGPKSATQHIKQEVLRPREEEDSNLEDSETDQAQSLTSNNCLEIHESHSSLSILHADQKRYVCRTERSWSVHCLGNSPEPFEAASVPINKHVYNLLQYFAHAYEPTVRFVKDMLTPKKLETPSEEPAALCLREVLSSKMEAICVLACMSARMSDVEGSDQQGQDLKFVNQALQCISKHICHPFTHPDRLVRSILLLVTASWHLRDYKAFLIHMNAVKSLVDLNGGIRRLSYAAKSFLIKVDGISAAEQLRQPMFDFGELETLDDTLSWQRHKSWPTRSSTVTQCLLLGDEHSRTLGHATQLAIRDLVECVNAVEYQRTQRDLDAPDIRLIADRLDIVRHRILCCDTSGPLDCITKIAVLIWMLAVFTSVGRRRSVAPMAELLLTQLSNMEKAMWHNEQDLYEWILIVGAMVTEDGSKTGTALIDMLLEVCTGPIFASGNVKQHLVSVSKSFLFVDVQDEMLCRLSERVEAVKLGR